MLSQGAVQCSLEAVSRRILPEIRRSMWTNVSIVMVSILYICHGILYLRRPPSVESCGKVRCAARGPESAVEGRSRHPREGVWYCMLLPCS